MSSEQNPFLQKKYPDLQTSKEVSSAVAKQERLTGTRLPNEPTERIGAYLERIKAVLGPKPMGGGSHRKDFDRRERNLSMLKRALHARFIIKSEDIPESYWDLQRRLAREQGHGDIQITDGIREQQAEILAADQANTLDTWVDYLSGPDATYPDWLKYWAFRSVLGMGEFDKTKKAFTRRTKSTVKPFPDLNREALAYVLDAVEKKVEGKGIDREALEGEDEERFGKLLQGENFPKLYAWAIEKVTPASKELLTVTDGRWVKYDRGSDHMPLVKSLQGHGTGWCTAGESTAKTQLNGGDFHVFYSLDEEGNPTIPRVAIRM
ncbi:hypothetical protein KJ925_04485, partial [Patescibacteria group bacterium]|nr:hypothetical protein [Patescibacteria group bacterium]